MTRTPLKDKDKKVRKPKTVRTIQAEYIREKIAKRLADELDPIIDAQILAAKGEAIQTSWNEKTGETTVSGTPSVPAFKNLLEQVVGRPKETVEHQGKLSIVDLVRNLEDDEE